MDSQANSTPLMQQIKNTTSEAILRKIRDKGDIVGGGGG